MSARLSRARYGRYGAGEADRRHPGVKKEGADEDIYEKTKTCSSASLSPALHI